MGSRGVLVMSTWKGWLERQDNAKWGDRLQFQTHVEEEGEEMGT